MNKGLSIINNQNRGAIILAGGDSKRLGQPKALLDFNGKSLIELIVASLQESFDQITLVTDRPALYENLSVKIIDDQLKENVKSPLRGIHAGLKSSELAYQFVVACDMPFINMQLINYMAKFAADFDAVVPLVEGYYQPLHAFYSRNCVKVIEEQVKAGCYKVIDFYARINIHYINREEISRYDPEERSFLNINTWSDYETALALLNKQM